MGSVTDWDSKVVIGSKSKPGVAKSEKDINAARRSGAAIDSERKLGAGNKAGVDPDHQRIAALDRKDDPTPPATISAHGFSEQTMKHLFKEAGLENPVYIKMEGHVEMRPEGKKAARKQVFLARAIKP